MSTETIRFFRDGEKRGVGGGGRKEVGEKGDYVHLSLHCQNQNDSCIKMGSDPSHFNVSLTVRDKVTVKTVPTDHNF